MARAHRHLRSLMLAALSLPACFDPIPAFTLSPPLQASPGTVAGRVTDACSGRPIGSASVIATEIVPGVQQGGGYGRRITGQTDSLGRFQLLGVPSGRVQLLVGGRIHYISKLFELELGENQAKSDLEVALYLRTAVPPTAKLDLLFVIDDSSTMIEEQTALADVFESFVNALKNALNRSSDPDGGKVNLDLRVGVVSTDLGAGGRLDVPTCQTHKGDAGALLTEARIPGCSRPLDAWISLDAEGNSNVPAGSSVPLLRTAEAFACIGSQLAIGCAFEQPLEAARLALDPLGPNGPFLRSDASLALILVTDEDDCSAVEPEVLFDPDSKLLGPLSSFRCAEFGLSCINDRAPGQKQSCAPAKDWLHKVEDYVAFFKAQRPGRFFFAALAGPTHKVVVGLEGGKPTLEPSCYSALGSAVPGLRIKAVADQLPASFYASICDGFVPSVQTIASRIVDSSIGLVCPAP